MTMNEPWIKFRKKLLTDGRVRAVSRECHVDRVTVIGALVTLWSLADDHADDDGVMTGFVAADVDEECGVPGLCAALPADWIDLTGAYVRLPEYADHNGTTAKRRAEASERKRKQRERDGHADVTEMSHDARDKSVTRIEERREEENRQENSLSGAGATASATGKLRDPGVATPLGHDVAGWLCDHRARHCCITRTNNATKALMARQATGWLADAGIPESDLAAVMTWLCGEAGHDWADVSDMQQLAWHWPKLLAAMRKATAPRKAGRGAGSGMTEAERDELAKVIRGEH